MAFAPPYGFGCMGITALYGPPMPDDAAQALLQGVYDSGCRHFDTAEMYRSGDPYAPDENTKYNEEILGKFFATVPRESFTVGTKYDPGLHADNCVRGGAAGAAHVHEAPAGRRPG